MEPDKELELALVLSANRFDLKMWQWIRGEAILGVAGHEEKRLECVIRPMAKELCIERDWAILSLIGSGIGIGTSSAEIFLTTLKQMDIEVMALRDCELFIKALIPSANAESVYKKVYDAFISS
jgi:aspartokinase